MTIELRKIVKSFGSTVVLDGIDLAVRDGELLALLGPSGSGKTTLLRIIAGLDWPDKGHVLLDGMDALTRSAGQRQVGFVFQNYALFRHMTVFENVAFGLRVQPRAMRQDSSAIRSRVAELLELVQLGSLASRYPNQLSGGQRQRIALARALAIKPRILLLDEPFGALDAQVRKDLRKWLRSLHSEINITTILVTHDQEEALEVADRIAVVKDGRFEQIGTSLEIYENPQSAFVHGFIGQSIELPVVVDGDKVRFGETILKIDSQNAPTGASRLFVRRHDLDVLPPDAGALNGEVGHCSQFGGARRAEVHLCGASSTFTIEIDVAKDLPLETGQFIGLSPRRYRVYPA